MKAYLSESCIAVNNKFDQQCFIYDRVNRVKYDINEDAYQIIEQIKRNNSINSKLYNDNKDYIEQLFDLNILKANKQRNTYNVKKITRYNNARIFAEITNKCNLKCKHCYGNFEAKNNNFLDISSLKKLIRNARKSGVYQFDLTGGEPLLYPHLEELLKYLYESGMIVRIFSNLTLINKKMINILTKYGVKEIITSLDSALPDEHDKFRGVKNSFNKTSEAIKLLQKYGITISVNTMVGNHNKNNIKEMVEYITSLNVKSVMDVIIPAGRAVTLSENIRSSARIIKSVYNDYYNIVDFDAIAIKCGIGDRFVYLKSDGNIYLCPSLISNDYKLSDIDNYDTEKIWKKMTQQFAYIRCNKKQKKCQKCNGGCRARALLLHNNICAEDDVYCIISGVE